MDTVMVIDPTAEDIEAIADFIALRLALITPPMFPRPDDAGRAILALAGAVAGARAAATSLLMAGTTAIAPWTMLLVIAHEWRDHPDYRPEW